MRDNPNETRSEPLHAMFDPSGALKTAKLFDDILHFSVVQDRLTAMELSGRYRPHVQFAIWDGLIRTPEQAAMFDNILDVPVCIYFDESLVPRSEMRKHWEERNRPGETWELFLERQEIFAGKAKGLRDYYDKTGRLLIFNPAGTKEEVFERFAPIAASYKL